jgi:hypothetical protein
MEIPCTVWANPMYIRSFLQGNHQVYGHIRCMYTVWLSLLIPVSTVSLRNAEQFPLMFHKPTCHILNLGIHLGELKRHTRRGNPSVCMRACECVCVFVYVCVSVCVCLSVCVFVCVAWGNKVCTASNDLVYIQLFPCGLICATRAQARSEPQAHKQ